LKLFPSRLILIIMLTLLLANESWAQLDFVKKLFEPKIFDVTEKLKDYIRNDLPPVSHDRVVELEHIDMIYLKAIELSGNQPSTALLATSFAVLNRTSFSPDFPVIGKVKVPLPSEDSADAVARIEKLPRYFFPDSPEDKWGDSAKLIHFFGSAYLTYESGTTKVPDAIGVWIEEGETAFKLDSLEQKRDVFINRLGQKFGDALSDGRSVLPSDYLSAKYIRK